MTGKELIIYILENDLEDEPVFNDGNFLGFMTTAKVAEMENVGVATVYVWIAMGQIDYVKVGNTFLIPANYMSPQGSII